MIFTKKRMFTRERWRAASPGSLGGIRALAHLRGVLSSVKVHVLPSEVAVPYVDDKFDGDGIEMVDEKMKESLEALGASLVAMLRRLHRPAVMYESHLRYQNNVRV